jgi:hypothetical protein
LEPILEEDTTDEPSGGNGEAALVEGHERDHEPLGGAAQTRRWGSSTPRWRWAEEARPPRRDVGAARGAHWNASSSTSRLRSLRRAGSARSGDAADAKEHGEQDASVRGRKQWEAKSWTCAQCAVLKGQALLLAFDAGPVTSAKLLPTRARAPVKQPPTRATPRSPQNMDLQHLRAAFTEWSRPLRRPKCPRPLLHPHLPRLLRRGIPKLQWLQSHIKARKRVSDSLTSSGATFDECTRAHLPRTRRTPSTPGSSSWAWARLLDSLSGSGSTDEGPD